MTNENQVRKMRPKRKIKKKKEAPKVTSYKNCILMIVSLILFLYAGFIGLYPAILTWTFNYDKFSDSVYKTTALVTKVHKMEFSMTPTFDMIITANNWVSTHFDKQNAFEATEIKVKTTPFAIFTKDFQIKSMEITGAKLWEQFLPSGENKLAYIPKSFYAKPFGAKVITIRPSAVDFNSFTIVHQRSSGVKEEYIRKKSYSLYEVKNFLMNKNIVDVVIK
ncbi:MAG: hypothetical protein IJY61_07000 [Candidatus Gastranaerophilales bacterium]|nr:hypothetical protein [Candidatus Gastranaerophilales bacterium]